MDNKIGDILREKRLEKNYTLEQLSKLMGVSINYISMLEKHEKNNPSDEIIEKLSTLLNINEVELFFAYGKVPLTTKKVLLAHPALIKAISGISIDKKLPIEKEQVFQEKVENKFKKAISIINKDKKLEPQQEEELLFKVIQLYKEILEE